MRFKNEIEYVFRILMFMASHPEREIITSQEISQEEVIPHLFSMRIMKKMEKAGLLEIIKGSKGGYKLKKKPEDISLKDAILCIDDIIMVKDIENFDEVGTSYAHIMNALRVVEKKLEQNLENSNFKDLSEEWLQNK